ncbi:MAG: DUF1800 domain-containing protein [Bacteroidetes bacterium]|nr:MAG: DUF1800 domain-containing protein [Bacteroidota bacterium]
MNAKKLTLSGWFNLLFLILPISLWAQTPVILGSGNTGGMTVTTSDASGEKTVDGLGLLPNETAASRFLGQATLGADFETIMATTGKSFSQWIDEQFALPRGFSIEQQTRDITEMVLDSSYSKGIDPNRVEPRVYYWHTAWWQYTMTQPDVLRNRVALALSEIFVISERPSLVNVPLTLANYYDMLLDDSFGNFRKLLEDVTLHPAMGFYLTHVNNPKSDSALNRFPDENYAREVMQLFTIGLFELNNDGTEKLDSLGNPIPTYSNTEIREFAKVFTGLTFGDAFLFGQNPQSELSYTVPMIMKDFWHEPGPKYLLNGFVVPNRNPVDGMADINDALDNLFNHPNVGPFIARRLIQRLVTSNPSPEYIDRVASAFNDNGQGVRGDMKAVIKAILLDPEARDCALVNDPFSGMLREPMVRYTQLCRAFNAYSLAGTYRNDMDDLLALTLQRPLAAPHVFNFFSPDYQPIGAIADANMHAPEFEITNAVTILGYANRLHDWIMKTNQVMEYRDFFSGETNDSDRYVNLDLTDELALDEVVEIGDLVERLNLILAHGQLTEATRAHITKALEQVPQNRWETRVRMAIFLVMISPDYLIIR